MAEIISNVRDVSWSTDCYLSVMVGVTKKGKTLKTCIVI